MNITIHRMMWTIIGVLVAIGTVVALYPSTIDDNPLRWHLHRLFSLDAEKTIPAWFQSMGLVAIATLLAFTAYTRAKYESKYIKHWIILAAGFALMSMDEFTELHEYSGLTNSTSVLTINWLSFGIPLVIIVALSYIGFLRHVGGKLRNGMILAGGLYVGGAVGCEFIASLLIDAYGQDSTPYVIEMIIEETLEMAGIAVMLKTMVDYLKVEIRHPMIVVKSGVD